MHYAEDDTHSFEQGIPFQNAPERYCAPRQLRRQQRIEENGIYLFITELMAVNHSRSRTKYDTYAKLFHQLNFNLHIFHRIRIVQKFSRMNYICRYCAADCCALVHSQRTKPGENYLFIKRITLFCWRMQIARNSFGCSELRSAKNQNGAPEW